MTLLFARAVGVDKLCASAPCGGVGDGWPSDSGLRSESESVSVFRSAWESAFRSVSGWPCASVSCRSCCRRRDDDRHRLIRVVTSSAHGGDTVSMSVCSSKVWETTLLGDLPPARLV